MAGKKKENYKCSCGKNVTKSHSSIGCFICGGYFHISCVNVSHEQHKLFQQNKNTFHYVCGNCISLQKENTVRISSITATDVQSELHNLSVDIAKQFDEHNHLFEKQVQATIAALEAKMIKLFELYRQEQDEKINKLIKEKLNSFHETENDVTKKRLSELELGNSVLQRRLNRSNIIVKGLPKNIKDLQTPILKIATLTGCSLDANDLHHCAYIYKGDAVLVKLNSIHKRDTIMMNFSKSRFFLLKDIIGGDITSKVFLHDHLTPAASKLLNVCKNLREKSIITKYRYINLDVPKVKVTFPNNMVKDLNTDECLNMLHDQPNEYDDIADDTINLQAGDMFSSISEKE